MRKISIFFISFIMLAALGCGDGGTIGVDPNQGQTCGFDFKKITNDKTTQALRNNPNPSFWDCSAIDNNGQSINAGFILLDDGSSFFASNLSDSVIPIVWSQTGCGSIQLSDGTKLESFSLTTSNVLNFRAIGPQLQADFFCQLKNFPINPFQSNQIQPTEPQPPQLSIDSQPVSTISQTTGSPDSAPSSSTGQTTPVVATTIPTQNTKTIFGNYEPADLNAPFCYAYSNAIDLKLKKNCEDGVTRAREYLYGASSIEDRGPAGGLVYSVNGLEFSLKLDDFISYQKIQFGTGIGLCQGSNLSDFNIFSINCGSEAIFTDPNSGGNVYCSQKCSFKIKKQNI